MKRTTRRVPKENCKQKSSQEHAKVIRPRISTARPSPLQHGELREGLGPDLAYLPMYSSARVVFGANACQNGHFSD